MKEHKMRETRIITVSEKQPLLKKWFNGYDLMKLENVGNAWLWQNYIPFNEISILTGPSDTGKSSLVRQLVLSILNNDSHFLGFPLTVKHNRVIYISTEDGAMQFKINLEHQLRSLDFDRNQLKELYCLFDDGDVFSELGYVLKQRRVDLIVFDTASDTFDGNGNNFVDVRKYLKQIKGLIKKHNCSALLIHHNVKNSEKNAPDKNKLNGSQGFEAKCRSLFELRNGSGSSDKLLTILKGNYVSSDMKRKSVLLHFNEEQRLYQKSDTEISLDRSVKQTKYERDVWLARFSENYCTSIRTTVENLKQKFTNENVPSETWFKENSIKQ